MNKETAEYILGLIVSDISQASDNHRRAEITFKNDNLDELYGCSGSTKRSILNSYANRLLLGETAKAETMKWL